LNAVRVEGDETPVYAIAQPLLDAANVERDRGQSCARGFNAHEPERLGPYARHQQQISHRKCGCTADVVEPARKVDGETRVGTCERGGVMPQARRIGSLAGDYKMYRRVHALCGNRGAPQRDVDAFGPFQPAEIKKVPGARPLGG
jgi:hypothetical protein